MITRSWLRNLLGEDFFGSVVAAALGPRATDNELERVKRLTQLRVLLLPRTRVTDEGVKKLQEALPNCDIRR